MGINRRHEHMATGATVTMAGRRAGLAAPYMVVMRQVTARRAQGTCSLENWGSQVHTDVADPPGVCRVLSLTVVAGVPFLVGRDEARGFWCGAGSRAHRGLVRWCWACSHRHGQGVAAGRGRWEAPEGAFPSKRLVACLSVQCSGSLGAISSQASKTSSALVWPSPATMAVRTGPQRLTCFPTRHSRLTDPSTNN